MCPGSHKPCYWRNLSWNATLPTSLTLPLYCVTLSNVGACRTTSHCRTDSSSEPRTAGTYYPHTPFSLPFLIVFFLFITKGFERFLWTRWVCFLTSHFHPNPLFSQQLTEMTLSGSGQHPPSSQVQLHDLGGIISLWIIRHLTSLSFLTRFLWLESVTMLSPNYLPFLLSLSWLLLLSLFSGQSFPNL